MCFCNRYLLMRNRTGSFLFLLPGILYYIISFHLSYFFSRSRLISIMLRTAGSQMAILYLLKPSRSAAIRFHLSYVFSTRLFIQISVFFRCWMDEKFNEDKKKKKEENGKGKTRFQSMSNRRWRGRGRGEQQAD